MNKQMIEFWVEHKLPCLSLYQPTHRYYPDNQQDLIRFRNLVKGLEKSLSSLYPTRECQALLKPYHDLEQQGEFWTHTLDGLAVLGARDMFQVMRLQHPVPELAIVANSFHTKPLLRLMQAADRYQILGLSQKNVRLFEGNRDALDEMDLAAGVPRTLEEALGTQVTEPHLSVASHGPVSAGPTATVRQGQGTKKDEMDTDLERFFRAVDRAILEHHSRPSGLPLMLVALPEYQTHFHRLSHNPFLLEQGLEINPEALSLPELRQRAWEIIEPQHQTRLAKWIEQYGTAKAKGLGTEGLTPLGEAALAGRVDTLLIQEDRRIPGRLNPATGRVEFSDLRDPGVDDLLDDLGELVMKKGGQVLVVPAERMPTQTGVAAIYRY